MMLTMVQRWSAETSVFNYWNRNFKTGLINLNFIFTLLVQRAYKALRLWIWCFRYCSKIMNNPGVCKKTIQNRLLALAANWTIINPCKSNCGSFNKIGIDLIIPYCINLILCYLDPLKRPVKILEQSMVLYTDNLVSMIWSRASTMLLWNIKSTIWSLIPAIPKLKGKWCWWISVHNSINSLYNP